MIPMINGNKVIGLVKATDYTHHLSRAMIITAKDDMEAPSKLTQ